MGATRLQDRKTATDGQAAASHAEAGTVLGRLDGDAESKRPACGGKKLPGRRHVNKDDPREGARRERGQRPGSRLWGTEVVRVAPAAGSLQTGGRAPAPCLVEEVSGAWRGRGQLTAGGTHTTRAQRASLTPRAGVAAFPAHGTCAPRNESAQIKYFIMCRRESFTASGHETPGRRQHQAGLAPDRRFLWPSLQALGQGSATAACPAPRWSCTAGFVLGATEQARRFRNPL